MRKYPLKTLVLTRNPVEYIANFCRNAKYLKSPRIRLVIPVNRRHGKPAAVQFQFQQTTIPNTTILKLLQSFANGVIIIDTYVYLNTLGHIINLKVICIWTRLVAWTVHDGVNQIQ